MAKIQQVRSWLNRRKNFLPATPSTPGGAALIRGVPASLSHPLAIPGQRHSPLKVLGPEDS